MFDKWLLRLAAIFGSLGGISGFLYWAGVKPKDLRVGVMETSPHVAGLVIGLLLFAVSIGLSLYSIRREKHSAKKHSEEIAKVKQDYEQHAATLVEQGEDKLRLANEEHQKAIEGLATPQDSETARFSNEFSKLCEGDAKEINNRIKEFNQRFEFHLSPTSDPYIDVITELWNGSIFQFVNFGEIRGHVVYGGKQIAGDPRIIVPVEPAVLHIRRGESLVLTVRQYLSVQVADGMIANMNRDISINLESVVVPFRSVSPHTSLLYGWHGPKFAIEDAKRV